MAKIEKIIRMPQNLLTEGNRHDHWTKLRKRNQARVMWLKTHSWESVRLIKLPCVVIFTRIAPRHLDFVNLCTSCKHFQDFIADLLIPGLQPGRADADSRIVWRFEQIKGAVRYYALKVEIMDLQDYQDIQNLKQTCRFCLNPDSILSKETCCSGCSKLRLGQ
jgi:hypothetical protein